jgi:uncharacterized protein YgiM (DUF1202 family)
VKRLWLGLAILAGIVGSVTVARPAWAARPATVDTDNIELREGPGANYRVLDKLPKGTPLAASNQPIDGYYKVRTGAGVIGFVAADALVLQAVPSEDAPSQAASAPPPADSGIAPSEMHRPTLSNESAFRNTKSRRYIRIKAIGGYNFFSVGDVNTLLSANVLQFGFSAGGEIDFMFTQDLAFVIRIEKVFKSVFAQDQKTLKSFSMNLSSYPVMAGLNLALTSDTKWSTHFAVMGGLGLLTDLTAIDLSDAAPNVTEMTSTTFTGVAAFDLTYSFSKTWSVFAEVGYRYLQTSPIIPGTPTSANGAAIFEAPNTQAFSPVSLNLSGPFVGGGMSVSF